MTREQFINEIAKHVQKYAPKYGIKVHSPIIAQAILESASGTSELAVKANNYFGLKYKSGRCPSACGIYYKDGSEQNPDGTYSSSAMQWFKFSNVENGVKGYFEFISISRYANLKGVTNPKTYLENIKNDGYATSIKYVDNLMAVIEKYGLTKYDQNNIIKEEKSMATKKIGIDRGHGLRTSGKQTPNGIKENALNDAVADLVVDLLKDYDVEFIHTDNDEGNIDESLESRRAMYVNQKVDAFVSIHHNASSSAWANVTGVEVYTDNNPTAQDIALANAIYKNLPAYTGLRGRGIKKANFVVINQNSIPAVLVEGGFMNGNNDYNVITSAAGQMGYAKAVAEGLISFLGLTKKQNTSSSSSASTSTTATSTSSLKAGDKLVLKGNNMYYSSSANASATKKSGTYYVWSNDVVNGRIRITNAQKRVGVAGQVSGWVNVADFTTVASDTPAKTGYDLIFDATYYSNNHADLKKEFGTNKTKLLDHFKKHGMQEGRKAIESFDVKVYKENNEDLQKAFGDDYVKYFDHYITYGYKEQRKCV